MATTQTKTETTPKLSALEKIKQLQEQISAFQMEAVKELKEKIAVKEDELRDLHAELEELTGVKEKKAGAGTRTRKPRSASISDEELKPLVLKVLSAEGKNGLNATEIAKGIDQGLPRVRTFLKAHESSFKKTGSLRTTKYFLK